jgi:phosphoadenosine phosphosulfate reductase
MGINTSTAIALEERARQLNREFAGLTAQQILGRLLRGGVGGRVAVVSSFGAEAACLLKLVADKDPATPVVFLDTRKHFAETLVYVDDLMDQLGMTTLVRARPAPARLALVDPDGTLNARDSDRCCYLRKTLPMIGVLKNYDCVLTGRKRFQTDMRAEMDVVEVQESWLRVNPLAEWTRDDVLEFLKANGLLEHPLVSQGYASIGCEPCTAASDDPRAGRWAGTGKTECGIHVTEDGRIVPVVRDEWE